MNRLLKYAKNGVAKPRTNRFGLPVFRELAPYFYNGAAPGETWCEVVPLAAMAFDEENPPNRVDYSSVTSRLTQLEGSVRQVGIISPPVLTPDYRVIDFHRRGTVLRKLRPDLNLLCVITSRDASLLYAQAQPNQRPHNSNDKLHLYLVNPEKLTDRERLLYGKMESVIGRELIHELCQSRLSVNAFHTGQRVARALRRPDSAPLIVCYVRWACRNRQSNEVEQLVRRILRDNDESGRERLLTALATMSPLDK